MTKQQEDALYLALDEIIRPYQEKYGWFKDHHRFAYGVMDRLRLRITRTVNYQWYELAYRAAVLALIGESDPNGNSLPSRDRERIGKLFSNAAHRIAGQTEPEEVPDFEPGPPPNYATS